MHYNTLFKNRTIRFRFVFSFTSLLLVFLCVFAVMIYLLLAQRVDANIQKSLVFGIQQSKQNFFDQYGNFHLHENTREHHEILHFIIICIYDVHGRLLYSSHDVPDCVPGNNPSDYKKFIETKDGKYQCYSEPFIKNAGKRYLICAYYFQENEKSDLQALLQILLFAIILSVVVCIVGGWYFASHLLFPFRRIAEEASRISVENLDERLQYRIADDEVGRLCITLNDLFTRLHASFEALKRFTSNASHEFKTPLAIMRGEIEVLLRKRRLPEEYEETLHYTIKEIDRMIRLCKGLLLLAQAESRKMELETMSVSLAKIVEKVIEQNMRVHSKEKQITIEADITEDIFVCGNADWIWQIVENLLINALQYTPDLGHVKIMLQRSENYAQLTIINTGPGIPPQDLSHIFERFYRIDQGRARKKGGFGLGLAICKALAEAHQGSVKASSIPGKQTTFSLLLPLS